MLLRGTGCSLEQRSGGLVRIFPFVSHDSRELKLGSAGNKHIEAPSCRFLLGKSEEKGDKSDHKQGNPVVRGKMLSYPIDCYVPSPVNVFPLPSEIKVIITGTGAEKYLARPYLYTTVMAMLCGKVMPAHKCVFSNAFWENPGSFPILLQ